MNSHNKRRCIFCMTELNTEEDNCSSCGKGPWEYQWSEDYLQPGTLLNSKYFVGAALGRGANGITYIAYDTVLKQKLAIKEFFPKNACIREKDGNIIITAGDQELYERKKQKSKEEASLIFGNFDIPGICNIKDYFEENNTSYIVEEFLPGGTFADFMKKERSLKPEVCVKLFTPVIHGLCRLHSMGILHMDISPDNLMFDSNGDLKLIDFGAAKYIDQTESQTELKETYAPPEQYRDTEITGPWTDVYAICAVMYQAITGIKPDSALKRINKDNLKPVSEITQVNQGLSDAIMQGLSLNIRERFFSCSNLLRKAGFDADNLDALTVKTRSFWGDRWLLIATDQKGEYDKTISNKINRHKIKVAAIVCACLLGLTGIAGIYLKINPEIYFDYKLNQAIREYQELEDQDLSEGSEMYNEVMKVAEDDGGGFFKINVKERDIKRLGIITAKQKLLCLDHKTALAISEHYLGAELKAYESYDEGYCGTFLNFENGEGLELPTISYTDIYKWENDNGRGSITMEYDIITDKLLEISITADKESCKTFLKEVFPYLVPETYFTNSEINKILKGIETSEYYNINYHPKFNLSGYTTGDGDTIEAYYISIK